MHPIGLIAGVACLAIWSYLLLLHGGFWKVWRLQAPKLAPTPLHAKVAIVIPARDEADVIGAALRSLLEQRAAELLHIFVVDDHSSDGTAQAARRAAQDCGRSDGLTVLPADNLPAGWTGKLWAVQQGIEAALRLNPEFLLLTDADIVHSSDDVATLVCLAQTGNYDLTSFMVRLHCHSLAEKLLIPA